MKRLLKWLGACTALSVAVVVASCDDGPTNVPDVADTAAPVVTPESTPFQADVTLLNGDPNCLNDLPGNPDSRFNNATCTANDIEIKVLQVLAVDGVPHVEGTAIECVEGDALEVDLRAFFGLNAQDRYDIGYYFNEDGSNDARTGQCFHGFLDPIENGAGPADPTGGPPYDGPYTNSETDDAADFCGDVPEDDEIPLFDTEIAAAVDVPESVTLFCQDPITLDGKEFIEVGTCTSWDNNDRDTCEGVADAVPGTPSKCNCDPVLLEVRIRREATVEVIKDLIPSDDLGTFDLQIRDYAGAQLELADGVGDGGTTGVATINWFVDEEGTKNFATVEEIGANLGSLTELTTPSAFDFYDTSYTCVNGSTIGPTSGTGPETLTLENGDAWVCTFTNTRIPPPAVTVTKDANETFDRAWDWQLTKGVFLNGAISPAEICSTLGADIEGVPQALQLGQDLTVCYKVTATPSGPTDTGHAVAGTINVSVAASTAPYSGDFVVTDVLTPGAIAATVDCDAGAPVDNTKDGVAQGGSFSCTYSALLPNADNRTNTATAAVTWNTGDTDSDDGTADVVFGSPTTETDELADVSDVWNGQAPFDLATNVPASGGMDMWTFTRDLSCPDYGDFLIENDATLTSNDTPIIRTDDADVPISCPRPPSGCTLTQGFWRTHSLFGPAPYDEGWLEVGGADTQFSVGFDGVINSGMTYFAVLWDSGKGGNAWFKLGHQYIAAQLNILNGADPSLVSVYMADAQSILNYYDLDAPGKDNSIPKRGSEWCTNDGGSGACSGYNSDRQFAMHLNNVLTQYNEGTLPGGPEHCDDDAQSLLTSF